MALAMGLSWAAGLAANERNPAEVDRFSSDLIELSTRHNFVFWLASGLLHRGWTRSVSGDTAQGIDRAGHKRLSGKRCGAGCQFSWDERPKHCIWRIVLLRLLKR
jgi:hypothetical protein